MIFKGVVFNEMKGYYSDPEYLLQQYTQTSIFPDNAYGVDGGGDPKIIPDLTYEQFKQYHDTYYHPSNARIWWPVNRPSMRGLRKLFSMTPSKVP